jgi:hypothetical protein
MAAPVETFRANKLKNLAAALPAANQRVSQGLNDARQMQLQDTIKQASPTTSPAAAQQLGGALQKQAGQQALQMQATGQKQQQQVGQQMLAGQQLQQTQRLADAEQAYNNFGIKISNSLAAIDRDAKAELLDKQLDFNRNQANQLILNERQLSDFAALSSRSQEEYQTKIQIMGQAYERKAQLYEASVKTLKQTLQQGYLKEGQRLNQESKARIVAAIRAAEEQARKAKARASNRMAMGGALGTVTGIAVGGALIASGVGAPVGATLMVGAAGGGALGQMGAASTS